MPSDPRDPGAVEGGLEPPAGTGEGAPTESLVSSAVGDGCVNCGAPLASDQRYCVVCGERRGPARFTLPPASPAAATTAAASTARARAGRGSNRFPGTGFTLVAGVATLLLAMLVGVLIGHNTAGGAKTVAAAGPSVKVITVGGGSVAPAAASTSAAASGAAVTPKKTSKAATKPAAKKKQAKAQQSAASKVLGGKSTPPPTVTVGAKGSGKGYNKKTHKFDGSFFGQ